MYFWYRHQYCQLFNRYVQAIIVARNMFQDILPATLVGLAIQLDSTRNVQIDSATADWDLFEPDIPTQ